MIDPGADATVTLALPEIEPLAARTLYGPPLELPAVNTPEELMLPPPETLQLIPGWVAMVVAN